jgi:hypothetical protein
MHGAFSRPFFTDAMTRIPGEMDKRTAEVKEPFKHIKMGPLIMQKKITNQLLQLNFKLKG